LNGLIQFTLFPMGKFNSNVEPPLGTDCVRLSRVHCTYFTSMHWPAYGWAWLPAQGRTCAVNEYHSILNRWWTWKFERTIVPCVIILVFVQLLL